MPPALSQAQTTGARTADLPQVTVKYWNNHKKGGVGEYLQMQRASYCCPSAQASSSERDAGCRRAGPSSEINEARHAPSGPSVPACPTAGTELGLLPLLAPQQFINCLFVYLKAYTVCARLLREQRGRGRQVPRDMGFFVPLLVLHSAFSQLSWLLHQCKINGGQVTAVNTTSFKVN